MKSVKLYLLCAFGAAIGCNAVLLPAFGIAMLSKYLLVKNEGDGGELNLPTDAWCLWFFATATLLPIAMVIGLVMGWIWTSNRIGADRDDEGSEPSEEQADTLAKEDLST